MRDIEFRGFYSFEENALYPECREWKYGNLIINGDEYWIQKDGHSFRVIPESVGQLTGLKDKNGVEIYEGDFLQFAVDGKRHNTTHVRWEQSICCFGGDLAGFVGLTQPIPEDLYEDIANSAYEVIGNLYENPELC